MTGTPEKENAIMDINKLLLTNITENIQKCKTAESDCLRCCGIHGNFISNLRSGRLKNPSFKNIYLLAEFFDISMDDLVNYTPAYSRRHCIVNEAAEIKMLVRMYAQLDLRGKDAVKTAIISEYARIKGIGDEPEKDR